MTMVAEKKTSATTTGKPAGTAMFSWGCVCARTCVRPSGPAPQAFALCYRIVRFVAAAYAVAAAVDSADESTSLAI